jgi:hypothetical protein
MKTVTDDIQRHKLNGVDLNPYSTNRARASWQNGYEGKPATLLDWLDCYQRGRVAKQVMAQIESEAA